MQNSNGKKKKTKQNTFYDTEQVAQVPSIIWVYQEGSTPHFYQHHQTLHKLTQTKPRNERILFSSELWTLSFFFFFPSGDSSGLVFKAQVTKKKKKIIMPKDRSEGLWKYHPEIKK